MATDVKKGQQYVVDGAIFKCDCGSAPCQITAISNQKVKAQGKAIVTDKDVTFKLPSAPFVTCSKNTQTPPTCVYANGIWKTQTTVQQGDQNAIVEKSIMNCPVFGGEIKCIYTGQVQSVSAPELAEFKIETLSNFPLALVVTPPAKRQEDKGKKVSSVYSVSASKEYVRPNEVITLHAFDKGKKELKPTDILNWAVTTRKETKETVKGKIVSKECIDKLTLIKRVCTPFNISFQEPGIYYIEGGSDKIADKYSALKTDQQLVIEKGKKKPPFDESCKAVVEVLEKNRIVGIRLKGDYIKGEDDDTIFLKNSDNLEIIVRTAVDLESHEKLSLLINKHLTKEQAMPLPKYVAQVSNEYSFTLKPSFFNDNKKTVDITLSEETPYSFNFLPIGTFDTKSFTVKEVDSFVSAFVSLDKDGVNQIQKDSYLRPGTTIYLILRPTNKTDKNVDLSKAIWTIKEKYGNSIVRGGSNIHKLTFEGEVTISLDLSNCNTVINANDKGVTQASFSFNVSRNVIKGIVRTPKVFYPNIDYWINFDMLYKYDSFKDKEVSFFLDGNEIKAESDSYKVIFDKNQIGTHSIYYSEKGQLEFEVREASIEKWQFVDEHHNKISEVGFDEPFYLEIKVPAWKDIKNEKVLDNVRIFLWDNNVKDPTPIKISALDDARFGKDGNAFIKLSISKQDIKVDGRKKINIIASLINPPYTDVVNLSKMKGYDSHWVCSKSSPLTLTTETCVTGFFSGKSGNPQKSVMKYGDSIFIMLATHNCKEITDRIKVELVENNKVGEKDDTVIAVYDNLEFGNNGKVKIDISEHFKNEDVHGDNPNPRLFYFGVKLDDAVIYTYPQSHEDVFNMTFKKKCEVTATKELQDSPSAEESEQKESECEESDTTVITQGEENYSITKGEKSNDNGWNKKIRSYLWQLKVGKDKEIQRLNHSLTNIAPVVVGEELKKGEKNTESGCKCPRCREDAKELEKRLKKMFVNASSDAIKTVAETYCKYQRRFGMDSCWIKAHFFAQVYVESSSLTGKTEDLNYSAKNLFIGNPNLSYFNGKWERCKKYGRISQKKKDGIYDDLPADKQKDFHEQEANQREIANLAYATRPGNEGGEDGWNYRGRGLIQLTAKGTYKEVGKIMKVFGMDKEGFECDLVNNRDLVASDLKLAVVASMAYFHYKNCNMHSLCNGNMNVNEISKQVGSNKWEARRLAFDGIQKDENGNETKDDRCTEKIFELDKCDWDKIDCPDDVPSYHTFFGGRVEKHIPKGCDEKTATHYIFYYHKEDGTCVEICRRTIVRNEGLYKMKFVGAATIPDEKTVKKNNIQTWEYSSLFKDGKIPDGVDGRVIYFMPNGDRIVKGKPSVGNYKYVKCGDAIELVRIDEGCTSGLFQFNKEGVKLYYQIDNTQTIRFYSDPNVFAILIGILAEMGANTEYDIKFRGTGNTEIHATGYPSQSHVNGMSLDFCYSEDKSDSAEVKLAKDIALLKAGIKFKCKTRYTGTWNSRKGGREIYSSKPQGDPNHNNHIHLGPFNQEYNKPTIINEK